MGEKSNHGTAVVATVLVVSLVVAVAAVVIMLVVGNNSVQDNDTINVGQITVNNPTCTSTGLAEATKKKIVNPNIPEEKQHKIPSNKPVVKPVPQPAVSAIPGFKAMGDQEGMTNIDTKPAGIMNSTEEARGKKWDPEKNFPTRNKPHRGNTLGAKFGPDETEIQMHLPTPEELFASRGHVSGPKYIRRGPAIARGGDFRPIMIPQDYDDYDKVRRPNRPRINQEHFRQAIEHEQRIFKHTYPSIVAPVAN